MPRTQRSDLEIDIAKGLVPGHRMFTKYCENRNVDATEQDVWDVGGTLSYLSSAETLNVVGAAGDTSEGTGTRTIIIAGLDGDYNEVGERITMNGVTPVPTVNQYLRVFKMAAETVGSNGGSVGNIDATAAISATIQSRIPVSGNSSAMSHFTVPAGHTAILVSYIGGAGAGKSADFYGRISDSSTPNASSRRVRSLITYENNFFYRDIEAIRQKQDFKVTAISSASGTHVDILYRVILVQNKYISSELLTPNPFRI